MTTLKTLFVLMVVTLATNCVDAQFTLVTRVDPESGDTPYADVWGEGNYAYVGSFASNGVWIFDISEPANAFLETRYNPGDEIQFKDIKIANGIGYFASDHGFGVHVVDLSDPTSPTLLSAITSSNGGGYNSIHNVFIKGDFLYEADSRSNVVKVIDVSNPSAPSFVRNITTTDNGFIHDVTVMGNRLYTSGFGGKTDIYDVSGMSPTQSPTLLGSINSGSNSHSNWATDDGTLLVSAREINDGDIRLYDISDPSKPVLRSMIDKTTLGVEAFSPHNPVIVGDTLYVAWYEAGLRAFDISDPDNPELIGSFETFDGSGFGNWGVYPFLGTDRILLSDSSGGLFIVSTDPKPEVVVVPESFMVTRGSFVSGGVAELAESDNDDLSIQRAVADTQSRTQFMVNAFSPVANPVTFEVTLEGAVFARSTVNQSIELFDYDSGVWEQVDSSDATHIVDSTVTVSASGDLSRFVQQNTLTIEARIRYQSVSPRQRFSSNTDQFVWTIGQ